MAPTPVNQSNTLFEITSPPSSVRAKADLLANPTGSAKLVHDYSDRLIRAFYIFPGTDSRKSAQM